MERKVNIYSSFKRPEKVYEMFDPADTIVETAGYITVQQRINNMMVSGERLKLARAEKYDFKQGEPVDENFNDPTRDPNFDLADASQILNSVENSIQDQIAQNAAQTEDTTEETSETEGETPSEDQPPVA